MPSVCRRIVVLLCAALFSVGALPLSAAHAQSAGDQQYSDPFDDGGSGSSGGGSGSSNSNSGSSGSSDSGSGGDPQPLTPAPQTSGGGSSSGSGTSSGTAGTSSSGTSATSTAPAATLPNTGLDTRVLLIGGAVLVLFGVGLRLRNAPERF